MTRAVSSSLTRGTLLGAVLAASAVGVGAITLEKSSNANAPLAVPAVEPPMAASDPPNLVAAAQLEGRLSLIAMPRTWANHGAIIAAFGAEYGISVTVQVPNATSAHELAALRLMRGQQRLPDIIEVGPSFAVQAVEQGLVQPYKVTASRSQPNSNTPRECGQARTTA